jgi:hypothetical protein
MFGIENGKFISLQNVNELLFLCDVIYVLKLMIFLFPFMLENVKLHV